MKKELEIGGMSCQHCVHSVRMALATVDGVQVKEVRIGGATVETASGTIDEAAVRAALAEEGFDLKTVV